MEQKNPIEIREKILSLLRIKGPSLPVHISKETDMSMLFSSAFLAELASEKEIKISNLKVGGSPLYYMEGQEMKLEKFYTYLPGKEKQAFLLLKQKKYLEDKKLPPALRVALRNLKDFAFPLVINKEDIKILFWRFYNISETEVREKLQIKPKIPKVNIEKPVEKKEIEKPLLEIKEKPIRTRRGRREKSDFVKSIISLLIRENIEIIEEKTAKKKEFETIVRINSDIGKIKFLLIAKDKKRITENDLTLALQKAQALKMPAFIISGGELNKKAQTYLDSYSSLIKFRRLTQAQ